MAKLTGTVILSGDLATLLRYVVQGTQDGLTVTVPHTADLPTNGSHSPTSVVETDEIAVGDTVRVIKPGYGCETGDQGVVTFITRKARGISVEIEWGAASGGGSSSIAGSYLQRVKKA